MDVVAENWELVQLSMAAFVGWGFGFAIGIIIAVITAVKDKILNWFNRRRSDED